MQSREGPIQEIHQGDIVRIPPGVKHWHGAAATSSMTYTATRRKSTARTSIGWRKSATNNTAKGRPPPKTQEANTMNKEPSTLKKTFGDFSPKLVDITDNVLFGDIWERPELSKRDRSLVTVAALTQPFRLSNILLMLRLTKG